MTFMDGWVVRGIFCLGGGGMGKWGRSLVFV